MADELYVLTNIEKDILDYYYSYCEITLWFKKIIVHTDPLHTITVESILKKFIAERNTILIYVPIERKKVLRKSMNSIAIRYSSRLTSKNREQIVHGGMF